MGDTCCGGGTGVASGVLWLLPPGWGAVFWMLRFPLMPTRGALSPLWMLQRLQLSGIRLGCSMENAPIYEHLVAVSSKL